MKDLTVVVTNFQRPGYLARCLASLGAAGIENVVVSSACATPTVFAVIEEYSKLFPGLFHFTNSAHDYGCNETWLRGLYYADTKYVLILHDDDFLDKTFGQTYKRVIAPALEQVGFASWRGRVVTADGIEHPAEYFQGPTRICPGSAIMGYLASGEELSVSPVLSVFRREDAIATLKEAAHYFKSHHYFTRPTMMVGNDLLLYLRAAEKYQSWLFVNEILTYHGSWEGSETAIAHKNGLGSIKSCYNATRQHFLKTRGLGAKRTRRVLHVWSKYETKNETENARLARAQASWSDEHESGHMLPFSVLDCQLSRSSKTELGDCRVVPFLRDLLDYGISMAQDDDVVVVTNSDTGFVVGAGQKLLHEMEARGLDAAYAWRHNFYYGPPPARLFDLSGAMVDGGVDLLAVTPAWWRRVRSYVPDLLLGCIAWDFVLRCVIEDSQPGKNVELYNLIWHEWHDPFWRGEARFTNPGQQHNMRIAKAYFIGRGKELDLLGGQPPPPGSGFSSENFPFQGGAK